MVPLLLLVLALLVFYFWATRKSTSSKVAWTGGLAPFLPDKSHWLMGHAAYLKGRGAKAGNQIDGLKHICVEGASGDTGMAVFDLFNQRVLSVTRAEHVKEALACSNHRANVPVLGNHMRRFLGHKSLAIMPASRDDQWKFHRKVIARGFYSEHLKQMVADMGTTTDRFVATLRRQAGQAATATPAAPGTTGNGGGQRSDLFKTMKMVTLDTIGLTAFGFDFQCVETLQYSEVAAAFEFLLSDMTLRTEGVNLLNPWFQFTFLPTKRNRRAREARKLLRSQLADIVHRKERAVAAEAAAAKKGGAAAAAAAASAHKDLLYYLIQQKEGEKLSEDVFVDNLITLLFGGFDTTSIALSYALYLLWRHPEHRAKCVEEARRVFGEEREKAAAAGSSGGAAPASYDTVNKLVYNRAVFKEAMRLYPPAPLTVRHTTKDSVIGGVDVPRGTMLYVPIWWVQRSEYNFKDPEAFRPERFLPGSSFEANPYAWIPFSGGQRNCVGQRFAMIEGTLVLAKLVEKLEFNFEEGYTPDPVMQLPVQKPRNPMMVEIKAT